MSFLKTTVVGGIVFLVPIIVAVIILGKAFGIMTKLAAPLGKWIQVDRFGGVALADLLAVVVIVGVCFVAGLIARNSRVTRAVESLESNALSSFPGGLFVMEQERIESLDLTMIAAIRNIRALGRGSSKIFGKNAAE